jgi:hypothetical protein
MVESFRKQAAVRYGAGWTWQILQTCQVFFSA